LTEKERGGEHRFSPGKKKKKKKKKTLLLFLFAEEKKGFPKAKFFFIGAGKRRVGIEENLSLQV